MISDDEIEKLAEEEYAEPLRLGVITDKEYSWGIVCYKDGFKKAQELYEEKLLEMTLDENIQREIDSINDTN